MPPIYNIFKQKKIKSYCYDNDELEWDELTLQHMLEVYAFRKSTFSVHSVINHSL